MVAESNSPDRVSAADDRAPTNEQIDADLMCATAGYDPRDGWAEYSFEAMRDVWRAGYEWQAAERDRLRDTIQDVTDACARLRGDVEVIEYDTRLGPFGSTHDAATRVRDGVTELAALAARVAAAPKDQT